MPLTVRIPALDAVLTYAGHDAGVGEFALQEDLELAWAGSTARQATFGHRSKVAIVARVGDQARHVRALGRTKHGRTARRVCRLNCHGNPIPNVYGAYGCVTSFAVAVLVHALQIGRQAYISIPYAGVLLVPDPRWYTPRHVTGDGRVCGCVPLSDAQRTGRRGDATYAGRRWAGRRHPRPGVDGPACGRAPARQRDAGHRRVAGCARRIRPASGAIRDPLRRREKPNGRRSAVWSVGRFRYGRGLRRGGTGADQHDTPR